MDTARRARSTVADRVAEAITNATSPTLLLALLYPVVGALAAGPAGVAWSLVGMLFTVVIPAFVVDRGVRSGRYTDHHLREREQRAVPLGLAAGSVALGVVVLALVGAPLAIVALQGAVLATLVVATLITLVWKVSFHLAVVAAAATALTLLGGGTWALSWLTVPAVAWARLVLRAHTAPQVVAGLVVGAGVSGLVLVAAGVA